MKLQKKLKNKVTGKALALLAPARLLNRLDWKSDLHGAGHFGTLEIRSDVIELKATVEGSYHHLKTRVEFIIFQGRFQCNSLRLSSLRRSTGMYNHDQSCTNKRSPSCVCILRASVMVGARLD